MTTTNLRPLNSRFEELVNQVGPWAERNFGEDNYGLRECGSLMGVGEELFGELNEFATSIEDEKDAIADAIVFLADFFYRSGLNSAYMYLDNNMIKNGDDVDLYYGRCLHHCLKHRQGIRGYEDPGYYLEKLAPDAEALFDSIVALYRAINEDAENLNDLVQRVWTKVSQRDWKKHPENASKVVEDAEESGPSAGRTSTEAAADEPIGPKGCDEDDFEDPDDVLRLDTKIIDGI